jgi:hypothetical protein
LPTKKGRKKRKKLTRTEALKRAKHMASSYTGAGKPRVKKIRGKEEYEYVFPIRGSKNQIVAYGVGSITSSGSYGSGISKGQADLLKRSRKKRKKFYSSIWYLHKKKMMDEKEMQRHKEETVVLPELLKQQIKKEDIKFLLDVNLKRGKIKWEKRLKRRKLIAQK